MEFGIMEEEDESIVGKTAAQRRSRSRAGPHRLQHHSTRGCRAHDECRHPGEAGCLIDREETEALIQEVLEVYPEKARKDRAKHLMVNDQASNNPRSASPPTASRCPA
jgi:hypothetical protein